ncbi:MAG: hypothetical protein WCD69_29840, partial [Xanthobacteraceae bacterium]
VMVEAECAYPIMRDFHARSQCGNDSSVLASCGQFLQYLNFVSSEPNSHRMPRVSAPNPLLPLASRLVLSDS